MRSLSSIVHNWLRPGARKPTPARSRKTTRIRVGNRAVNIRIEHGSSAGQPRESIAKQLPGTIFLLAVSLYFAGWMYAFYLYRHFGLSLRVIDPPFYYIFVYAYSVLSFSFPAFILSAVFVAAIIALQLKPATPLVTVMLALVVVLVFPLSQFMSYQAAEKTALKMRRGYGVRSVTVTFTTDTIRNRIHPDLIQANTDEQLRLFAQTSDAYIFLVQPRDASKELPIGKLFLIPKTSIASVALNVN